MSSESHTGRHGYSLIRTKKCTKKKQVKGETRWLTEVAEHNSESPAVRQRYKRRSLTSPIHVPVSSEHYVSITSDYSSRKTYGGYKWGCWIQCG